MSETFQFSGQDARDGSLITYRFDVTRMWEALRVGETAADIEAFTAPMMGPAWLARVRSSPSIKPLHLEWIRKNPDFLPVVLAVQTPDGLTWIVDGHHRILVWAERGDPDFKLIRWKVGTWKKFLI